MSSCLWSTPGRVSRLKTKVARILRAATAADSGGNKVDRRELVNHAMEFYALGLMIPCLFREHGRNIMTVGYGS